MLTQAQIDQYHSEGYVAVADVYPMALIEELRQLTDELVDASRQVTCHTEVYDIDPAHSAEVPVVRRIKQPADHFEPYRRALRYEPMLDMVSQLIGPGLRYQNTKLNLKPPRMGTAVEWHQDLAGYPHTNEDILAVGIPLDDMFVENGALMVLPGSHKGPVFNHHTDDGIYVAAINDLGFSDESALPLEVSAGGITIHHGRMVHGSRPNFSDQFRRLLLIELRATDAWPLVGISDWDKFNARILRGQICYAPRLETVPVRIPYPEPPTSGSIFEGQQYATNKRLASQLRGKGTKQFCC
jgi:ectoine hydroxylase-related dioxygenase (phytanoyl-CoA dioxygenase family)